MGSTVALGLSALAACTSDDSWKDPSTIDSTADGPSGLGELAAGRPTEIGEVLPASTLLALGDGTVLRLGETPDSVELVDRGAILWRTGGTGSEPGQFHRVTAATVGPDGSFWIVDAGNRRVQVLTSQGEPSRVIGAPEGDSAPLRRPLTVAVAPDGRAYVGDAGRSGVVPFAADGTAGELIGGFGSEHPLAGISALQIAEDELVVVEALVPRVQVWDLDGRWVRTIELPEHFATSDLVVDDDQIYLVSHDGRLVRTTLDGSSGPDGVVHLGHVGSHAAGLHLGADGLVVAAVPVPSYVIR